MLHSTTSALKLEYQRQEQNNNKVQIQILDRLSKLIDYEILLFQIIQSLTEWPKKPNDFQSLISKCKQCFTNASNGDNVVPRSEILDASAALLLNSNEAQILMTTEMRYPSSELYTAISTVIVDMEQQKTNPAKKISRDAWDLVLPMFSNGSTNTQQQTNKRGTNAMGGSNNSSIAGPSNLNGTNNSNNQQISTQNIRDSPTIVVSASLMPFLKKLRDPLRKLIACAILQKFNVHYLFL